MTRLLLPSTGPDDWKQFLAQPDLHWQKGYSARTLAHAWEAQNSWPPEIAAMIEAAVGPTELLFGTPEHKTPLPGGSRESQSDVFALGRHHGGLIACTIEGKVNEPFGPTVVQQMLGASPGKQERLAFLLAALGLSGDVDHVHYQLLHRTVAALIEARRFAAAEAAMIVHSFSSEQRWFDAFARFAALFGKNVEAGQPVRISVPGEIGLYIGWAHGDLRFLSS